MAETKENDVLKGMSMLAKVARFFVLIGEESTVKIFQHLPKDTVEKHLYCNYTSNINK